MKRPGLLAVVAFCIARLSAADPNPVVPLWPEGAPRSEARKDEPEKIVGDNVSNIHFPTITAYLPAKAKATGCAVIIAPGGGHRYLVMQKEGYQIAEWLANHGVAGFVLKNRLANDDATPPERSQPYTVDRDALADAQRAIRVIRSRAAEWKLDPARIGIIGFSAGGEIALLAGTGGVAARPEVADIIERQSSRPNFFGLIYPGGLRRSDVMLSNTTPPVFLACGHGDNYNIAAPLAEFYLRCKQVGMNAELHIYAGAGHGFGIDGGNNAAAATWIARFHEWLADRKFITPNGR